MGRLKQSKMYVKKLLDAKAGRADMGRHQINCLNDLGDRKSIIIKSSIKNVVGIMAAKGSRSQ